MNYTQRVKSRKNSLMALVIYSFLNWNKSIFGTLENLKKIVYEMNMIENWSQLKIIEYQNKMATDEINTNEDMRITHDR